MIITRIIIQNVKYAKYDKYKHRLHGKLERTVNTFKNITALKKLYSSRKILCYDFSQ